MSKQTLQTALLIDVTTIRIVIADTLIEYYTSSSITR